MRRLLSLLIIIGILLAGAFLTAQVAGGGRLLQVDDILPPEASVFTVTPDQRLALLGVVFAVGAVTFGMGATLAVAVNLLDKAYRRAMAEEAAAPAMAEVISPEELGIHLPAPSIAPFVVGLGAMLLLVGILVPPFLFVGLLVLLVGVISWAARARESH